MNFKGRIQAIIRVGNDLFTYEADRDFDDLQDVDRVCREMQDEVSEKTRIKLGVSLVSNFPDEAFESIASSFWRVDTDHVEEVK